ncbi:Proliferation-associated nucleolar protein (NOL1) [Phaffia rhodozyma]|uniref:Proliferation-associated nucleolar protein (NOL1) n=1 Tax=Phaffia rhodozyma TaxID=264483 RepID=A0A0F7SHU5_PHARH|nr:Proliferation-associated nucleolar protein (NOL1) [Phaffia rhodozyma]
MNLYFQAASFLDELELKQTSIKAALSSQNLPEKDSKRLLALVISTLKYKPTIQTLLSLIPLTKDDKKVIYAKSKNLPLVLVHDLIFAAKPGIQSSTGPIKDAILKHKTRLAAELVKLKIKKGVRSNKELQIGGGVGEQIPRYARINTNLIEPEELIAFLQTKEGGFFTFLDKGPFPDPIPTKSFHLDEHIPNLLVFALAASSILTQHVSYTSGHLILQDKASCFPAYVLAPQPSLTSQPSHVIDATAAPGNKTSHLSALLAHASLLAGISSPKAQDKVHAFELSPKRFKVLEMMIGRAGCTNVELGGTRRDFLETDPYGAEWRDVKYLLLDPSCSGSGIVNRLDFLTEEAEEENDTTKKERLDKLAGFQLNMIRHAMKFPNAKKLVYSTCSIHPEEDEHVVLAALESKEAKEHGWSIAPRSMVLPDWDRRGRPEEMAGRVDLAESVVRCEPGVDKTNGFFVSCFIRANLIEDPAPMQVQSVKAAKKGKKRKAEQSTIVDDNQDQKKEGLAQKLGKADPIEGYPATSSTETSEGAKKKKKRANKKKSPAGMAQSTPSADQ